MKNFFLLLFAMYSAIAAADDTPLKNAQILGWTNSNNHFCGGYFRETPLPGGNQPLLPLNTAPITISANQSRLEYNGISTLSGQVEISQPGRIITSHQASLTTQSGEYQTADLKGNVTIREKNKIVVGTEAKLDLQKKWYQLKTAAYRLLAGNHLNGWGSASVVTEPPTGITELKNITYSTCPPQGRAWHLTAKRLTLNRTTGRGSAYDAVLYARSMPILYAPVLGFPIDNRRQTGFLYPRFSFGSTSGMGFGTPFYWNIAPNQDDTVMPYFYRKRGFALNNQYRYLTDQSNGNINVSFLPNDAEFRHFQQTEPLEIPHNTPAIIAGLNDLSRDSGTRSFFSWQNHTQFSPDWSGSVYYTRVSDDYYAQDLGSVPFAAQNQLLQQGEVNYTGDYFNFLGNLQSFQTLHPVNEAVVQNQYNMLPQLLFTSRFAPKANTLNVEWKAEGVEFTQAKNPGESIPSPSGERLNFMGAVSLPWSNIAGFLEPKLGYQFTQYNLGDQPMGLSNEITRGLPFFDVDSGLYFERNTAFLSHGYTQTLEPRIFYLYVPYRNQSDIPIFDSSLQPFSFNQLFLVNRFSGTDRVGDANQISLALTSRFLDQQTGEEKFSASAGIIRYLKSRKVMLCQTGICPKTFLNYGTGSTSPSSFLSPLVANLQYHFNPVWSTSIDTAWDTHTSQMQNTQLNFHYSPAVNHIFNIGYAFIRNGDFFTLPNNTPQTPAEFNLSQPTTSFAFPLNDQWSAVGSFGYSLNRHHPLTYFGGVEYNSCCWATQIILAKTFSGFDPYLVPQYNTGVYVQLAFKGLAKAAANDPASLLLNNIPGYNDTFAA